MKNNKPIFSYYRFHTMLFGLGIVPIVIYVFHKINHVQEYDKLSLLIGMAIFYGLSALVYSRCYKMEKKDELVQHNLARANRITLYILLAVLFIAVIINDYVCKGLICSDFCWLTTAGALSLRSLLFTFFEGDPQCEEVEE